MVARSGPSRWPSRPHAYARLLRFCWLNSVMRLRASRVSAPISGAAYSLSFASALRVLRA